MGETSFQRHVKFVGFAVIAERHIKSTVAANRDSPRSVHVGADMDDGLSGILTLCVGDAI